MKITNKNLILIIVYIIVLNFLLCGCSSYENNSISSNVIISDSQKILDNKDEFLNVSSQKVGDNIEESGEANYTNESQVGEDSSVSENEYKCRLSVRCDAVLHNLDKLDKSKHDLIPKDGIIYESNDADFQDGESAFDLLLREMKNNEIHLEFEFTPQFESSYVEGIGNLYEFDCGTMSGWIYKVNGEISSCGCSQYRLKNDDYIEWIYMCGM